MRGGGPLLPLGIALAGGYGVFLLYTAIAFRWQGVGFGPSRLRSETRLRATASQWLAQAGLEGVGPGEFLTVMAVLLVLGTGLTFAVLGAALPALAVGAFAATYPAASYRARRSHRRARAADSWPRMIEEIALLAGSLGARCLRLSSRSAEAAPRRCALHLPPPTGSG